MDTKRTNTSIGEEDQSLAFVLMELCENNPRVCPKMIRSYLTNRYLSHLKEGGNHQAACEKALKNCTRYIREKERKQRLFARYLRGAMILTTSAILAYAFISVSIELYKRYFINQ